MASATTAVPSVARATTATTATTQQDDDENNDPQAAAAAPAVVIAAPHTSTSNDMKDLRGLFDRSHFHHMRRGSGGV